MACCSSLLQDYQASDNFRSRRDRTRHDYVQQIKRIERDLGDFPLAALTDRRTRGEFMEWRDKLALTSRRQADYGMAGVGAGAVMGERARQDYH